MEVEMSSSTIKQILRRTFSPNSGFVRWNRRLWKWTMNLALLLAAGAVLSALLVFRYTVQQRYTKTGWMPAEYSFQVGMLDNVEGYLTTENLESNVIEKLPEGVTAGPLGVVAPLKNPGWREEILIRAPAAKLLLILFVVWMLRKIVWTTLGDDGSEGNPFVRPNVHRLRWIAAAIALVPFAQAGVEIAEYNLAWTAMEEFASLATWYVPGTHSVSYIPFAVALLILALAEVFSACIRLREDVEGLV
jgi:hypothetical protein